MSSYQDYLKSPEWQAKRVAALRRAHGQCQVCNSNKNLDVHHRTYARLGHEDDADLTVLCRTCHEIYHAEGRMPVYTPPPQVKKPSLLENLIASASKKGPRITRAQYIKARPVDMRTVYKLMKRHGISEAEAVKMRQDEMWQSHVQHSEKLDSQREDILRNFLRKNTP